MSVAHKWSLAAFAALVIGCHGLAGPATPDATKAPDSALLAPSTPATPAPSAPYAPSPPSSPSSPSSPTTASPPASLWPPADAAVFPRCDLLHEIEASAESYSGMPAPFQPEAADVQTWARNQSGFEQLWVDRDLHNGWITLAFSSNAQGAQAALNARFPNIAAVVVPVDWTTSELNAERNRVTDVLAQSAEPGWQALVSPTKGVVEVDFVYFDQPAVDLLKSELPNARVCVQGGDPALRPSEGPQPTSGDGWRLLGHQDRTGQSYRTDIAFDEDSYQALWKESGITGQAPDVDFQSDIVIWFGAVHGSSCPRIRLDDVVVDVDRPLVHAAISELDYGMCTADAIADSYVVALSRDKLPHGPFAIQLDAQDPPSGVPEERTVINADLTVPGSTASRDEIHSGGAIP